MKIRIDPEFAGLIPAVPEAEAGELERTILEDGRIFEPLVVWKHQGILLDGHRRYAIQRKHPTIKAPPPIVIGDEWDRQTAHDWVIDHQLAKRNCTEAERRYLIGKRYRDHKPKVGRPTEHENNNKSEEASGLTAQEVAAKTGVSERTVRANAEFAEAVDTVAEAVGRDVRDAVLSGEVTATTKDLEKLSDIPTGKAKAAARLITSGKAKSVGKALEAVGAKEPKATSKTKAFDEAAGTDHLKKLRWWLDERGTKFGKGDSWKKAIAQFNALAETVQAWRKEVGGKVERIRN